MYTTVEDLLAAAVSQRPGDFEEAFNTLIIEKAANAINNKKTEIAQTIFNPVEEEIVQEEEETLDELSKDTLTSYKDKMMKKSSKVVSDKWNKGLTGPWTADDKLKDDRRFIKVPAGDK